MVVRRKKRAWNMSNPLYRYLYGKGKTKKRSVSTMARRKSYRRRSSGGFGMGGLLKPALIGLAVSMFGHSVLPEVDNRIKAVGVSYFMGGKSIKSMAVAGASAHFAPSILGGLGLGGSSSSSPSGSAIYYN